MRKPAFGTEAFRVEFWQYVDQSAGKYECWPWKRSKQKTRLHAYGNCWRDGRMDKAHRVMWELENFPIPDGYFVMHLCDNGWCVNPSHLVLGSPTANIYDSMRKQRRSKNEARRRARQIPPTQEHLIADDVSVKKGPE